MCTEAQRQEWVDNNKLTLKRSMPGSYEADEVEKQQEVVGKEERGETMKEVAEAIANIRTPSPVALTPTSTPPVWTPAPLQKTKTRTQQWEYGTDTEDSLSEEEKTNTNPIRRRINFRIEERRLRTALPTKVPSNSTIPEEDKIPVKIWPARKPRLAPAAPAANPTQMARRTIPPLKILTDSITRNVVPAVPMIVVPIGERRRLEDEYVDTKRGQLERGSPITDYSAGPNSPTREVTPWKIHQVADELAVIRDERERGVEVARNWNPAEPTPTPSPTPAPAHTPHETPRSQVFRDEDDNLYEDTAKARLARAITPEPGMSQEDKRATEVQVLKGPKGGC